MTENEEIKNNRLRYSERLKAKYPGNSYADDEALFQQAMDDYDAYENELSEYRNNEKALSDLFAQNPRSASFLIDWRNGEDPLISMIRKFGDDFKAALDDPEKQEALAAANKEYAERIAEEAKYSEEYQKNIDATGEMIDQLQAEEGLSEDEVNEAISFLVGIVRDGLLGRFSRESVKMALKAINHDEDVALADREGEVRGRNAKIEEKLRKVGRGDGTANLGSKNSGGSVARNMPDMGAIGRYYNDDDIWKRGGEVRKPYK